MAAGCLLSLGMTSCSDFLDVNVDPDQPTNESALVENRVPWIQRMYMYSAGLANYRTSTIAGVIYTTNGTVGPNCSTWNFAAGLTTSAYQTWYVESASNLRIWQCQNNGTENKLHDYMQSLKEKN